VDYQQLACKQSTTCCELDVHTFAKDSLVTGLMMQVTKHLMSAS